MKGAGGKPFPLALVERATFLEYVWPEFTMGEYISKIASIKHNLYASDSDICIERSQPGTVARKVLVREGHFYSQLSP